MQYLQRPDVQRVLMMVGGLGIVLLSVVPALASSRAEIAAAGALMFGWALKAPGHGGDGAR